MESNKLNVIILGIRWTARTMAVLLAGIFFLFLFGEGPPNPAELTPTEFWMFAGVLLKISGLLIAWQFEAFGASVTLAGYLLFSVFNGSFWAPPIFPLWSLTALLFLLAFGLSKWQQKTTISLPLSQ